MKRSTLAVVFALGLSKLFRRHQFRDLAATHKAPWESAADRFVRRPLAAAMATLIFALLAAPDAHAASTTSMLDEIARRLGFQSADTVSVAINRSQLWENVSKLGLPLVALLCALTMFAILRARRRIETPGVNTPRLDVRRALPQSPGRSELAKAIFSCRTAALSIGLFSGLSNILMLTGAFFMLQVYDRVLPSGSVPTLVALAILVSLLYAALAALDLIRSRILVRIGALLDEALGVRVYEAIARLPLATTNRGDGLQPLRDLDTVRGFISGPGPTALFDLPWIPVYLSIIFAFHSLLGVTAVIGALVLIGLTFVTELLSRHPIKAASGFAQARHGLAEAVRRNAEVAAAMGMSSRLGARWAEANQRFRTSNLHVSNITGGFGSVARALRMMLQSAVLGVGAYLVINHAATAGIIIAASILVGRALAPVDLAIAHWRGFSAARQSWKRLNEILELIPERGTPMPLSSPQSSLKVEHASVAPPGGRKLIVQNVSFSLASGQGLGIIGPSASGKSSLVRMIVGAWQPASGRIRLDGAALDQWAPEALGRHIGYLPQNIELFAGTVAENISRFEPDADAGDIVAAARAAAVHDLIVALPKGYDTEIGEQGEVLSAGQRQRIALARALYADPFLVVLDEPNSNLDAEGEAALTRALIGVRERGGIVVVVAHRPSALAATEFILVMANGRAVTFGPKDEVLPKLLAPALVPRAPTETDPAPETKLPISP